MQIVYCENESNSELNVCECGMQECKSGHSFGPTERNAYYIHFIKKGTGSFSINSESYSLSKGEGFFICPDTRIYYKADAEQPWSYCWIGFDGSKADYLMNQCGLSAKSPVISNADLPFIEEVFQKLMIADSIGSGKSAFLRGYLYVLLSRLISSKKTGTESFNKNTQGAYLEKAVEYLRMNYSQKVEISAAARYVGIDAKYLWRIFKSQTGMCPSQYLLHLRLEKACGLLRNTAYSVTDIACSTGYDDPLQFSRMFKKFKGCSPRKFRSENL